MSVASILAIIAKVTSAANVAIQAGKDAGPFLEAIKDYFSKGDEVTDADLAALEAKTDELSAKLQTPLPDGD